MTYSYFIFLPFLTARFNQLFHALKNTHKAQRKEKQKSPDCSWVDSNSIKGMGNIKGVRRDKSDWIWHLGY